MKDRPERAFQGSMFANCASLPPAARERVSAMAGFSNRRAALLSDHSPSFMPALRASRGGLED